MIEELVKSIPDKLLNVSGSVFYSGRNAFGSPAALYVLGINPGGSPESQAQETIARHTNKVLTLEADDWSAYRDESWNGARPGTWRMQPRVLHLMRRIGLAPGQVPASNVVFQRSQRENLLKGQFQQLASVCWPFHQAVLDLLKPRVILCFGATAGACVRDRLGAYALVAEFIERNERKWRSCTHKSPKDIFVVTATHPSIADWTAFETDPSHLVREALDS